MLSASSFEYLNKILLCKLIGEHKINFMPKAYTHYLGIQLGTQNWVQIDLLNM